MVSEKAGDAGVKWMWKKVLENKDKEVIKRTLFIISQFKAFSSYFEKGRVEKGRAAGP